MNVDAEIVRRDVVRANFAVAQLANVRRRRDGDLIESVATMDDQRVLGAERKQRARDDVDEMIGVHAEDLTLRECGIGERTEDIEDRAYSEFASHAGDRAHRRMQLRREQK